MSYTTNIKNEIGNINYSKSESIAELSAIVNVGATINAKDFEIQIENLNVSRRIFRLIKDLYRVDIKLDTNYIESFRKTHIANISIQEKKEFILEDLSVKKNNRRLYIPNDFIIDTNEEKAAYIRGLFLICGSINDPKTSRYHAEFIIKNRKTAEFVNVLLNSFDLNSKYILRDKNYMVYIKESEKISDLIKILGAYNSLFYYEDIRIYRDHKNMTNRLNNCEQANIDKIIASSEEQIELIKLLKEKYDFELLNEKIKNICIYKLKYPESSMSELAEIISTETGDIISKSGINHRFRKIKEMIKIK